MYEYINHENGEVLPGSTEILQEMTNHKNLYSSILQEKWIDFAPEKKLT